MNMAVRQLSPRGNVKSLSQLSPFLLLPFHYVVFEQGQKENLSWRFLVEPVCL
jgi:hypothetical protein